MMKEPCILSFFANFFPSYLVKGCLGRTTVFFCSLFALVSAMDMPDLTTTATLCILFHTVALHTLDDTMNTMSHKTSPHTS